MPRVRLDGGVIGVTNNPTSGSAGGMWSMKDHEKFTRGSLWPSASAAAGTINATALVVAGGGGGGSTSGGGGGAGGYISNNLIQILSTTNYSITVGAGGTAGTSGADAGNGSNSTFSSLTAVGGGGGGNASLTPPGKAKGGGLDGGSGGGGSFVGSGTSGGIGGSNTVGQGYAGGNGWIAGDGNGTYAVGGGGGGASAVGATGTQNVAGNGGAGTSSSITGTSTSYAGGGGGGVNTNAGGTRGTGGSGGGGSGGNASTASSAGTVNTGGGGGGAYSTNNGSAGGSGIVVINYPAPQQFTGGTITNVNGSNIVHTFTSSGSLNALGYSIDTYFPQTTLLLHGNGTNGANNTVFVDSSTNAFTVTNTGKPLQGTFSPFSQTGWGVYQSDVYSNYINFNTSVGSSFEFTGDYTIEAWIYLITNSGDNSIYVTNVGSNYHALNIDGSNFNIYLNSGTATSSFAHGMSLNTWYHVAMVRSGSTVTVYVNGVSKGTISSGTTHGYATPTVARNGGGVTSTQSRYMSNLRVVKGTAVYTSTFAPPLSPLTAISNTQLLTCQDNRFKDNSTNGFTLSLSGSPSIESFSPFSPSSAYSNTTIGGSIYFPGSSNYLGVASNIAFAYGTGDFSWEFWTYPTASTWTTGNFYFLDHGTDNGGMVGYYLDKLRYYNSTTGVGSVLYTGNGTLPKNAWSHIAVNRVSGTTSIYVNGSLSSSASDSHNYGTQSLRVGNYGSAGYNMEGYISNFRIVKGSSVYTSAFTPPTAPLTAISGTSLLLNATNAGIIDHTAKNTMTTYGSAAIGSSQSKFGGTSLYFDGSASYLSIQNSPLTYFGTGSFTIEFWVYPLSLTNNPAIIAKAASQTTSAGWFVEIGTNAVYFGYGTSSGTFATFSVTLGTNSWYHIACTRSGGTLNCFVNGVSPGSQSGFSTSSFDNTNPLTIGRGFGSASYDFNGYIDDLRVTTGSVRYTSNFTPPTSTFLDR